MHKYRVGLVMGAWGHGIFENDDAADWIYEFRAEGAHAVVQALSAVTESAEDAAVEAPEAASALAAAAIVAAVRDGDFTLLSELARESLQAHKAALADPALVASARRAVNRVASHSELRDLWHEGELAVTDGPKWLGLVEALARRLG